MRAFGALPRAQGPGAILRACWPWLVAIVGLSGPIRARADTVQPGTDYWQTPLRTAVVPHTILYLYLPAGVFGPTSEPFEGYVWFCGYPEGAPCAADPYGSDLIVHRSAAAELGVGITATVPITIEHLHWAQVVDYGIGLWIGYSDRPPEYWQAYAELSPVPQTGDMTITQTTSTGGTFDMRIYPHMRFTFGYLGQPEKDPVVYDYPYALPFARTGIPWTYRTPKPGSCTTNFKVSAPGPYGFDGNDRWVGAPLPIPDQTGCPECPMAGQDGLVGIGIGIAALSVFTLRRRGTLSPRA